MYIKFIFVNIFHHFEFDISLFYPYEAHSEQKQRTIPYWSILKERENH